MLRNSLAAALPWLVALLSALSTTCGDAWPGGKCTWPDNVACRETCRQGLKCNETQCAVSWDTCSRMLCSSTHDRCFCSGASTLKSDGTCTEAVTVSRPLCNASHRVSFNAALWASPDISRLDVKAGRPSATLHNVLDHALAAALELPPNSFAAATQLAPVHFADEVSAENQDSTAGGIIHFDLSIDFCAGNGTSLSALLDSSGNVYAFERRFRGEAQGYVAFFMGSIKMLNLKLLRPLSSQASPSTTPGSVQAQGPSPIIRLRRPTHDVDSGSRANSGTSSWMTLFIASAWSALASVLLILLCMIAQLRRRQNTTVYLFKPGEDPLPDSTQSRMQERSAGTGRTAQGQLICVAHKFTLEEVECDDSFFDSVLMLSEGDVVEILAENHGWYYGKVIGDEARAGYFPASRVASWLTSPIADGLPLCAPVFQGDGQGTPRTPPTSEPENQPFLPQEPGGGSASSGLGEQPKDQPLHAFVCETQTFSPQEMGEECSSLSMLALDDGDVVEVMAGSEGWLYGRVLGAPERAGYFPECRVISWMSEPLADSLLADGVLQHFGPCGLATASASSTDPGLSCAPAAIEDRAGERESSKESAFSMSVEQPTPYREVDGAAASTAATPVVRPLRLVPPLALGKTTQAVAQSDVDMYRFSTDERKDVQNSCGDDRTEGHSLSRAERKERRRRSRDERRGGKAGHSEAAEPRMVGKPGVCEDVALRVAGEADCAAGPGPPDLS